MPSILSPDLGLLFWMFLAFLIVFALVAKYGFPVIIKMVEDRKNYIDESLKKAREANEKLANIKAESEEILRQASERQAQVLKEAMATRDSIVKEARDKAREEGQKLLEEAKAQIAVERKMLCGISATRLPMYRYRLQKRLCVASWTKIPKMSNTSNVCSMK